MRDMSFAGVVLLVCAVVLFALMLLVASSANLSADGALVIIAIFDAAFFVIGGVLIALDKVRDDVLRKLEESE